MMMIGLILLIVVAYYLINQSSSKELRCFDHQSQANNPLDILNERYARGEIQREEYLEAKHALGQKQNISLHKG